MLNKGMSINGDLELDSFDLPSLQCRVNAYSVCDWTRLIVIAGHVPAGDAAGGDADS